MKPVPQYWIGSDLQYCSLHIVHLKSEIHHFLCRPVSLEAETSCTHFSLSLSSFFKNNLFYLLQPSGQSPGHGGAGAADGPGDHRGHGPRHPYQLLRGAELREPQAGRHQELLACRPPGRQDLQRGLQVRGAAQDAGAALARPALRHRPLNKLHN